MVKTDGVYCTVTVCLFVCLFGEVQMTKKLIFSSSSSSKIIIIIIIHIVWVLVGKTEGKRPFGITRRRWEDNIKMDIQKVGCEGMDWFDLAQDRDRWPAL